MTYQCLQAFSYAVLQMLKMFNYIYLTFHLGLNWGRFGTELKIDSGKSYIIWFKHPPRVFIFLSNT